MKLGLTRYKTVLVSGCVNSFDKRALAAHFSGSESEKRVEPAIHGKDEKQKQITE